MVDLTRRFGSRGQALLVTTYGIAVLFVVLAVVLNASAYSQTMAAGHGEDGLEAVGFAAAAADGVDGVLAYVNRHNDTDYATLQAELEDGVADWSENADSHAARRNKRVSVALTGTTNGSHILQTNRTRSMTSAPGAANWTLATGVSDARDVRLNVSQSSLVDPASDANASLLRDAEVFHLVVEDGSDTWRLYVYAESNDVVVRVEDASGTLHSPCTVDPGGDGYAVVDLSNASVEGTPCDRLGGFDDVAAPYSLSYRWGTHAGGNYSLFVDQSRSVVDDSDFGLDGGDEPYVTANVHAASIRVTYATPRMEYDTETTVRTGDSDA